MKNNQEITRTAKELYSDLQTLVVEAQSLMADSVSERTSEAVESLRNRLGTAQQSLQDAYAGSRKSVIAGARYTDDTIRAKPYQSIAVAAGIGLLLGALLGRSGR